ncbi:MAG: HEAT repeat domain-containing protein, partial [Myxococcota bacterium]
ATLWVSDYINTTSSSVNLNLVVITGAMFLLLATSYIEAMLIGDLLFTGHWRERVLLGQRVAVDPNSPEALQEGNYSTHNLTFLVVVALAIVGNYLGLSAVTGDFMETYHTLGFHLTRLRSADPDEKVAALKELSKPIYRPIWTDPQVPPAVTAQLDAEQPEVRLWALWAAGSMQLTESLDRVTQLAEADSTETAQAAAVALGRMGDKRATPTLIKLLGGVAQTDTAMTIATLKGIATLGDTEAGPTVMPLVDHSDLEVRTYAWWTVGQLRHTPAREEALKTLAEGSPEDRCAALDALKFIPTQEDILHFKDQFALTPMDKDPACAWHIWTDRQGEKHYIAWKESHRTKFMKIVFNASSLHSSIDASWFETIAVDRDQPYEIRLAASDLVRQIQAHGTGR